MSSSTDETRESRFFLGDRPCVWHKAEGQVSAFDGYQKIEQRILIIKEDATGDVLRTLALFPAPMQSCPATPFEVDSVQRSGYPIDSLLKMARSPGGRNPCPSSLRLRNRKQALS